MNRPYYRAGDKIRMHTFEGDHVDGHVAWATREQVAVSVPRQGLIITHPRDPWLEKL